MITREFLDSLEVMEVMEDWGSSGSRNKIATMIVQKLRESNREETEIIVEALHTLCPGSAFAYQCDNLMVRTSDAKKLPFAIQHQASFIEEVTVGRLKTIKCRREEYEKTLREWLQEAISLRISREDDCGSKS